MYDKYKPPAIIHNKFDLELLNVAAYSMHAKPSLFAANYVYQMYAQSPY